MVRDLKKELEQARKLARQEFSSTLMSDTKWRKLFIALDQSDIQIQQILVKFIDLDDVRIMRMPKTHSLHPPRAWIDTIEFGPVELRAIEWLKIPEFAAFLRPNKVPSRKEKQDIVEAQAIIMKLGLYPIEETDDGLLIRGYNR